MRSTGPRSPEEPGGPGSPDEPDGQTMQSSGFLQVTILIISGMP